MRLFGHPVHVMLVHFPVALWPAHTALHLFAAHFPPDVSAIAGFWLLAGGTILGWVAALFGAADLVALANEPASSQLTFGFIHAALNGAVLIGFTIIAALEQSHYPTISHGTGFLTLEVCLLVLMLAGNYFGGAIIWKR